jgi:hypothetical protein
MTCRVSTFAALLLDIHTWRKTTRRGAYVKPEDDKDTHKSNYLNTMRARNAGYDVPREQGAVTSSTGTAWLELEQDIAYHSRYGAEEETHGPLEADGHGKPLQDYEIQLMLLEKQNKMRLAMAREEEENIINASH